jgi:hypothetical protein
LAITGPWPAAAGPALATRCRLRTDVADGILAQGLDLAPGELPVLTGQQSAERHLPDAHTLELVDLVAELREHAANLAILALVEHHLQHGAELVL